MCVCVCVCVCVRVCVCICACEKVLLFICLSTIFFSFSLSISIKILFICLHVSKYNSVFKYTTVRALYNISISPTFIYCCELNKKNTFFENR